MFAAAVAGFLWPLNRGPSIPCCRRDAAVNILGPFNARAHILLHDVDLDGSEPHGGAAQEKQRDDVFEKLRTVGKVVVAGAIVGSAVGAIRHFMARQVTCEYCRPASCSAPAIVCQSPVECRCH
jgi:hypothetical protein